MRVFVLSVIALALAGLFISLAVIDPQPSSNPYASTQSAPAKPNIEKAIADCGTLLGFGTETVMTRDRIALLSLCLHPELKHLNRTK